jgi:4-amino-4-deoxychorismate lyase
MPHKKPVTSLINGIDTDFLNVHDRAIHYGDGVFETILCVANKLYYWSQHFQRLSSSARKLKIDCPQAQTFLDDINRLLAENKTRDDSPFVIKIILSRGVSERGYKIDNKAQANRIVLLSPVLTEYSSLLSERLLEGELFICQQQVSINESLAGIKHLNRLENVMARNEWQDNTKKPYIDGLMLNANQHVIEASMSNLFAVKENKLYTPQLKQSGINGIMRDAIIDLITKNNLTLSIINLTLEDLYTMDELFISNSLIGVKSVTKLADYHYQQKTTMKIFEQLLKTKENHIEIV